jgi:hypothetical protein
MAEMRTPFSSYLPSLKTCNACALQISFNKEARLASIRYDGESVNSSDKTSIYLCRPRLHATQLPPAQSKLRRRTCLLNKR